jgi:hypothetical protein
MLFNYVFYSRLISYLRCSMHIDTQVVLQFRYESFFVSVLSALHGLQVAVI